ncbi:sigma-70 family RNA polymerase sigma factor [Neorhodopirellula pilleata]|uniref:ECF RNA polymerase sigma factor SigW n=1 Tax=Neorhodopirellula pilleata TaxID=2714738 RepID=A0A5C6A4J8_9BACT|nr:sigma-70 family RNA polymerase sigma factor [Neorhodopirellula pilleata]TWT94872.1 ECF RNA polymerase sigma factor SigW [Neorhodopirellula pilleata]
MSTFSSKPTSTTVRSALDGDAAAFGELVQTYSGMVTGVAYSVLGDFARSEDAGQEAFLEAWRKRETLQDPSKFASWVCSIARYRALDLARRLGRAADRSTATELDDVMAHAPTVEEQMATAEEKSLVWDSLERLPPKYREVMVLYYRGAESVSQVAESIGENEATVRQRLVRGREMLRNEVQRMIQRTLHDTAPKAVFTMAVLGSLPGNANAAIAASSAAMTASGSQAVASTSIGKVVATGATAGLSGAIIGTLGGLAGAGLGVWMTYRDAPYMRQRRAVIRFAILTLVSVVLFTALIEGLVWKQQSSSPLEPSTYVIVLLTSIFGFQGILGISSFWFIRRYRTLAVEAKAENDSIIPEVAARQAAAAAERSNAIKNWTSPRSLWGLPLMDVQHGRRDTDGTIAEPLTARGWIAIGDRAHGGFLAIGSRAYGFIAIGGFSIGVLALGGFSVGVFAISGVSAGLIAIGGLSVGGVALGGAAIGGKCLGGFAVGWDAIGGAAFGIDRAVGGLAWSPGTASGGFVLGKGGDPYAGTERGSNLLLDLSPWSLSGYWFDVIAIVAALALIVVVVAAVFAQRVSAPPQSSDPAQAAALERNDLGAILGSMTGCTMWMASIGYQNQRSDLSIVTGFGFLIAIVATYLAYRRWRNRDRTQTILWFGIGSLYVAAMFSVMMAWLNGITQLDRLNIVTVAVLLQMFLAGHLTLARILCVRTDESAAR